ncbi:hypothetical protein FYK55_08120 [Roseiconus nitratireducens]|uniref:Dockerin domain-containing protein n=1 Tax=Roseiconus nitratireducens TaxID=2605748 RepID=A0A5M6DCW1_9BACT|nr:dockerin type I domain-containing protein [Roseiconus nitratireducens]KAA5544306.1 hypothetical protein FYK55_08120 [Roseiconus nitratireducens]
MIARARKRKLSVEAMESRRMLHVGCLPIEDIPGTAEEPVEVRIATDVNADGRISLLDALLIINQLPSGDGSPCDPVDPDGAMAPDVNDDGSVTPNDLLIVLNELANPGGDTAAALSSEFLKSEGLEWELARVVPVGDGAVWVIYATPELEAVQLGERATTVDLESRTVEFVLRE